MVDLILLNVSSLKIGPLYRARSNLWMAGELPRSNSFLGLSSITPSPCINSLILAHSGNSGAVGRSGRLILSKALE